MPTSMKKVILTSLEGERFELDEKVAMEMRTIQRLIDVKRELAMTTTTTTSSVDDFVYAPIEVSKVIILLGRGLLKPMGLSVSA
ncbi:hypothetical protein HS088_TW04G01047 [Tripterygium wilfordii]|uniref:SKP1 component POZ domain-containing protein n=1 Tax=Tripterygium wilfordii TaxID=458696 RepID=A0A7J7DRU9_TRIWF|nr:hypothetical protein HS088_TW04G01047 [Tripterygium wilfordii]